ncbi:MAG TPA: TVP38/TMEM64 family protein [Limnochordia bacterium]|nr:TVP38/TMEM64 family protein [Limnochordia bacterium]HPT92295.1 TVP38/TMEM64 family protein [Limnochordia bacterium]HPZ30327.1 TVP38/TMEM64 family protein [Limnochordia bacterium]
MQPTRGLAVKLLLAAAFLAVMIWLTIAYAPAITELAGNPEHLRMRILAYGRLGVLVFIGLQIVQVIITAIPGEVVQVAGGYIYGTWPAAAYLLIGVILGSLAAFWLARLLGYTLIKQLISEEKLVHYTSLLSSQKAYSVIFTLFLIPGLPKDLLTYIGGLTPVKPLHFIVIASIARIPAMLVSAYIGANLQERDYLTVVILSAAAVAFFLLGLFYRDRLLDWLQRFRVFQKKDN